MAPGREAPVSGGKSSAGRLSKKELAEILGKFAEDRAADYLRAQGYTIREQRWKPQSGRVEIDIIAQREADTLVFVEVKARGDDEADPTEAVDLRKMAQIARGADSYLAAFPHKAFYRFDIITFVGDFKNFKLRHFPDAFLSPLAGSVR